VHYVQVCHPSLLASSELPQRRPQLCAPAAFHATRHPRYRHTVISIHRARVLLLLPIVPTTWVPGDSHVRPIHGGCAGAAFQGVINVQENPVLGLSLVLVNSELNTAVLACPLTPATVRSAQRFLVIVHLDPG
jgi:hypothetical protein